MKIGILLTAYNCDDYIEDCLYPWFEIKDKHDIVISVNSGMFSDYYTLGIPYRNKVTLEKLTNYDIDFLIATNGKNLLTEDESRNFSLEFLKKQNCDLIWIIDGDEVYTKQQILDIIDFIEKNPEPDVYDVYFKNLTIEKDLFMEYKHGRIVWANRFGGIAYFYFDNRFVYMEPGAHVNIKSLTVPKNVAYIKHNSWLSDDSRTKDKIIYQNYRYATYYSNGVNHLVPEGLRCSYDWDIERDRLQFNKGYYNRQGVDVPCLHQIVTKFSNDFAINFSRSESSFKIVDIQRDIKSTFEIYNTDGVLIYTTNLDLVKDFNYFIAPSYLVRFDEDPNFYNFRVKVYENSELIHDEKIHLKIK